MKEPKEYEYNVMDWHYLTVIRLTLQTRTPLSIGQGGDGVFDNLLVTDANGLAAIPGTSFAGVLRHMFREYSNKETTDELFGNGEDNKASPSRVRVSWGCIHDQNDQPIEGLLLGHDRERLVKDPLLADASQDVPLKRDRVRIDHRGTASSQGQFDRVALRAGHRFSLEICLWSPSDEKITQIQLLDLLADPTFRLGGSTRGGFGAFEVKRLHHRRFNLKDKTDYSAYCAMGPNLYDVTGFTETKPKLEKEKAHISIELEPEDFFRFGQGTHPLMTEEDKDPDLLPVTEEIVIWDEQGGRLSERMLLIPATAIKGALRHRVAFHYNLLEQTFAEDQDLTAKENPFDTARNEGVRALFGFGAGDNDGKPGCVWLDDLFLEPGAPSHVMHNGIDRFTGGVREHVLYAEELVAGPRLAFQLTISGEGIPQTARQALVRALDDLVEGRLALGAGAARGHGYFRGSYQWNQTGEAWVKGGTA